MTERWSDERAARVALSLLAEPGNRTLGAMVRDCGAESTLHQLLSGDLPHGPLYTAVAARLTMGGDPRRQAEAELHQAAQLGARIVIPGDQEWPDRIDDLTISDEVPGTGNPAAGPPLCLWARGPVPLRDSLRRSVAILGARDATAYGETVTADIAYGLAERGWTVTSGAAHGTDAAAHRAALAAGATPVAILGCGIDRPYPTANAALLERIGETGLLVSEYPFGAESLKHRFLARNRIVAAVTAGAVMVEAAVRSGSIHMMNDVLALDRPAMVVPGPVSSELSAGCHHLLREQPRAILVTGWSDVLETLDRAAADTHQPQPSQR